jgi:acetone carboxylase gamma subunit
MARDTASGAVVFHCFCGYQLEGGQQDALIASDILAAGETAQMYERLLANAAHDRVNQQVRRDCPQCGLDYMAQVRLGPREVVVWKCKCGYATGEPAPRPPPRHEGAEKERAPGGR